VGKGDIMEIGELIKWYEMYGDINIVRNSGLGIIVSKYRLHNYNTLMYEVYRLMTQDTISLEECFIEKLKGVKNES
jgi:hypothetical protein